MNSVEINDRKEELRKECQSIIDTCKEEIRMMTDDEQEKFNSNKNEIINLNEELRKIKETLETYETPSVELEENKIIKRNNSNTMNANFRLIKAINDIANNRSMDEVAKAVNHNGNEEMRKAGLSYGGQIQLPINELRTITVASEGEDVVATDLYSILEPLRAQNVLVQSGAKFLSGLVGDVQVPIMSKSNVAWAGEIAPATSGDPTFSHVTLSPKRLTAYVTLSKQFLNQDSLDAEALIRQDIIKAVSEKLEATILGDVVGNVNQPDGLLNGTAVTADTYAKLADIEADMEEKNVTNWSYILSPKAKAFYRSLQKGNGVGFVYEGDMDGVSAKVTSNVEADKFIMGDFTNLAIGQWGSINLCYMESMVY